MTYLDIFNTKLKRKYLINTIFILRPQVDKMMEAIINRDDREFLKDLLKNKHDIIDYIAHFIQDIKFLSFDKFLNNYDGFKTLFSMKIYSLLLAMRIDDNIPNFNIKTLDVLKNLVEVLYFIFKMKIFKKYEKLRIMEKKTKSKPNKQNKQHRSNKFKANHFASGDKISEGKQSIVSHYKYIKVFNSFINLLNHDIKNMSLNFDISWKLDVKPKHNESVLSDIYYEEDHINKLFKILIYSYGSVLKPMCPKKNVEEPPTFEVLIGNITKTYNVLIKIINGIKKVFKKYVKNPKSLDYNEILTKIKKYELVFMYKMYHYTFDYSDVYRTISSIV